ncbi:Conserved_hypothetical protein [Hexamita inflata]|uniref:Uncharacterized protein n=1 Tax=Hexamita inflata TaxID=28002 RepID=A0AA86V531_9EUKA|nr:Conserved hypothetical protein [Hexamita inflata]
MDADSFFTPMMKQEYNVIKERVANHPEIFYTWQWQPQKPLLMICIDLLHLGKRARYRFLKKLLTINLMEDTTLLSVEELKALLQLPDIIWSDQKFTKMVDEYFLRMYSRRTLNILSVLKPTRKTIHTFIYFVLHYPLVTLFTKIGGRSYVKLLSLVLLVLKRFDTMWENLKQDKDYQIARQNNGAAVKILTCFSQEFIKQCICSFSKILQLLHKHGEVRLVSCGSYVCECLFGWLRLHSSFNNSYPRVTELIYKQEILKMCQMELGEDVIPMTRTETRTVTVKVDNKEQLISDNEYQMINQLSKDVMDLIFDDDCYDGENLVNGSIPKYQQLLQFWSDIDNSIEEETFMKEKLWQPISGMHTQNRLQPDKISKIENNNIVKDVFSEDSLDEV